MFFVGFSLWCYPLNNMLVVVFHTNQVANATRLLTLRGYTSLLSSPILLLHFSASNSSSFPPLLLSPSLPVPHPGLSLRAPTTASIRAPLAVALYPHTAPESSTSQYIAQPRYLSELFMSPPPLMRTPSPPPPVGVIPSYLGKLRRLVPNHPSGQFVVDPPNVLPTRGAPTTSLSRRGGLHVWTI